MTDILVVGASQTNDTSSLIACLRSASEKGMVVIRVPSVSKSWLQGFYEDPIPPRLNEIEWAVIDEFVTPRKPSAKRLQIIAQLNRAKAQRNKNLVRDLTRLLERTL